MRLNYNRVSNGVMVGGPIELYRVERGQEVLKTRGTLLGPICLNKPCLVVGPPDAETYREARGWATTTVTAIDVYQHKIVFMTLNSKYVLYGEDMDYDVAS